ncbi:GTP-binding protein [Bacillaceae bacterium IKA-2]|nr:GTP-binding protein [Bacillaceae bacterium IKA-2]
MKKTVPAYIITGFLGSGKTTVLQNILIYCKENNLKPAIVLNEIGDTNVEADLFADDSVLEMLNGCICCSIQADFTSELQMFLNSLANNEMPDVLLIEGTGVANPLEIVDALTDPQLIDVVDLYSVINLIDASKYIEYQSIFSSSKEVRDVLKSQITTSSFIILNKLDLINDKLVGKVRKKVGELKRSDTAVVETSYGEVDIQQLFERRISTHRTNSTLQLLEPNQSACCDNQTCEDHEHDHNHNHTFQALKIEIDHPIDRIQLEQWLNRLPKTIVRGKGIIALTETVGLFQFQYSSDILKIERLKTATTVKPCLILIGVDLDSVKIETTFREQFGE